MTNQDCPLWETCDAVLCPLSERLPLSIWFPGEDICKSRKFTRLPWVKAQKAIQRAKVNPGRYFTVARLEKVKRVGKGIAGLNPDFPLTSVQQMEQLGGRVSLPEPSLKATSGVKLTQGAV